MLWNRHSVSESASRSINRLQNEPKSVSQIIDFSWLFCFALTTKQVVFAGEEPKVPKHEVQNKEHAFLFSSTFSVCTVNSSTVSNCQWGLQQRPEGEDSTNTNFGTTAARWFVVTLHRFFGHTDTPTTHPMPRVVAEQVSPYKLFA